MSTDSMMREVKRKINEATMEMDNEAYCWFMRELADWCETQANMAEDDLAEVDIYDDND